MNRLKGQITEINTFEDLTLLNIEIANTIVKSIIIDDSKESQFSVGKTVDVLFKETELIISKNKTDLISLQNQFECTITALNKGKLLSQISLDFMRLSLCSIITTHSVDKLKLVIGDKVTAMVKTNEIMLSVC